MPITRMHMPGHYGHKKGKGKMDPAMKKKKGAKKPPMKKKK